MTLACQFQTHHRRIDLAVTKNLPRFIDVLATVLEEMEIQKYT